MADPQTTEVAANAVTGIVNMLKDIGFLYWVITIYSVLIGAAMSYVGKRHLKKLLFFVGAFMVYVPMHYFASEKTSLIAALAGGVVMVFCYPVYVFFVGVVASGLPCLAVGMHGWCPTLMGGIEFAGGVCAIIYRKHVMIPATAISGGTMLAFGLALLFKGMPIWLFVLLTLLFAASGIFVQYRYTAKTAPVPKDVKEN
ncbi:MAG: hypothetical protein K6F50_05150 [Kiritimatiellae bacterium]|nr:hypothetical protein [Kiritimatiellia bacterium]